MVEAARRKWNGLYLRADNPYPWAEEVGIQLLN
jgi:hypothetical protein